MVLQMPPKLVYRVGEHIGAHGSRTQPVRTASSPKKPGGSPVRPLDPAASSSSSSTGTRALFQGPVAADLAAMQPPEPEPAWESDADEEDEAAAEEGEEEEEADAAEHRSRITKRGSMLTSSSRRSLATLESGSAKQNGKRIREELADEPPSKRPLREKVQAPTFTDGLVVGYDALSNLEEAFAEMKKAKSGRIVKMEDAVVEPPPRTLPLVPTATTTTTTATTAVLANNNNKRIARTQNMSSPRPPSTPFLPLSNTDLQPCSLCGGVAHLYGNSLVVCRKCKTCFHQLCHYPKILEEALSYEPVRWVCASCTEKTKSAVPELLLKSQVFVRRHNEVASIAAKLAIASGLGQRRPKTLPVSRFTLSSGAPTEAVSDDSPNVLTPLSSSGSSSEEKTVVKPLLSNLNQNIKVSVENGMFVFHDAANHDLLASIL